VIGRASFEYIRGILADRTGTVLERGVDYLIESRLLPAARELNLSSVNDLIRMMQGGAIPDADQILIEALADKETSFFRDIRVFEALRKMVIPELITKRASEQKLSIWSIGCSTGQEPYSIGLLLHDHFPQLASWKVDIAAADISIDALRNAGGGRYNQIEINRGLPVSYLVKHFKKEDLAWRLQEKICESIRFFQMNILEEWPAERGYDIILLRNVIGGFAEETRAEIFKKAQQCFRAGGYLLLGAKDNPSSISEWFEVEPLDKFVCYRPKVTEAPAMAVDSEGAAASQREAAQNWPQLAKLVSSRDPANQAGVRDMLAKDPALANRIQKAANRNKDRQGPSITTLDSALQHTTQEQLLASIMAAPATKSLNEVFQEMSSGALDPVVATSDETQGRSVLTATALFNGVASGMLIVRLEPTFAQRLAGQALGLKPKDVGRDVFKGMVHQMVTLIGGNFQAHLNNAGLDCKVREEIEVTDEGASIPELSANAGREMLVFRNADQMLWIDIIVTPPGNT
jgi:chemotaxis protein methyltransferase CheR